MRRIMTRRLLIVACFMGAMGIFLLYRLFEINMNGDYYKGFDPSAPREVTVICSYGDIYDRNGIRLVNRENKYLAVINPESVDREVLEKHITDREKYCRCIDGTALFLCGIDCPELEGVTVIPIAERYSDDIPAPHIIGYTGEGKGVCGIEEAFDSTLRQPRSTVTLKYSADAAGNMLEGCGLSMLWRQDLSAGVRISLDAGIQRAAEAAMEKTEKGAAVVMDIKTGELCAVVSKPEFDIQHPEESLGAENSPFINRAFSAYSVGSAFKLVTAGAALEYGISENYSYTCTGSVRIRQNVFSCHRFGGHGKLGMERAMAESCNPYFIALGAEIPAGLLHDFAQRAGFGQGTQLAAGIYSAAGYLPSAKELLVPEEKANFSFGQGKISATPLQITLLTAAIANDGKMPRPVLVCGEGQTPSCTRVMSTGTARRLKDFMVKALYKDNSAAIPAYTTGGGKTSTAQTWTYKEDGTENMNCWLTGFFPADEPKYAVTVMIEEGVSGNLTCGPVFSELADSIWLGKYTIAK